MSGRGGKRDYGGFLSNSSSSSTKERLALMRDDSPAIDAGREEEEEAIQQFELLLEREREREREREQERRVTTRAESPTRPRRISAGARYTCPNVFSLLFSSSPLYFI